MRVKAVVIICLHKGQEASKSMELSTRKYPLYVLSQQILMMTDYHFNMLKYKGFIPTVITKLIMLKHLIEVSNGDSHLHAIEVNITTLLYLCLFEDLYCHEVLHLLHSGLHNYLVEKHNRISSSF